MKIELRSALESNFLFFTLLSALILDICYPIEIISLQETAKTYSAGALDSQTLSALTSSTWTSSTQYTMSTWVKMPSLPSSWTAIFSPDYNDGRLLLAGICSCATYIFFIGTVNSSYVGINPWNETGALFPQGEWVFVAQGGDSMALTIYAFRLYPSNTANVKFHFQTFGVNLPDAMYSITSAGKVSWGGDTYYPSVGQTVQHTRLYLDYAPSSQGQMLNLAWMHPGGTFYVFTLSTDYGAVANATIPVASYGDATQNTATAPIPSTETPTFGPYNTIMCRPGTIFSYETTTSTGQGVIFAFDILIHSPATTIQNLVSVRNAASNYVSLTVYYDPADGLVKVKLQNPIWNEVAGSDLAVELDYWNRVVVALGNVKPTGFTNGFYAARIFINQTGPENWKFFGDFSTKPLFQEMSNAAIDICSTRVSGSTTRNSSLDGNYDMMNFEWFRGEFGNPWKDDSDPNCRLMGFLNPNQRSCLICNANRFMDERTCVSSCPADSFLHAGSRSCQRCAYPSRYQNSTGFCVPCDDPHQVVVGSACLDCDDSCATCSGTLPTQCKSCPLNTYFLTTNSSCVACDVDGYFISGNNCTQCDSSCLTCNGALATNCLSCPSSPVATYLLSSNHSCIACNADHYFISGSECLQCDSSCLTCDGTLATNCLSCPLTPVTTYLLASNQSCVACDVDGYFIAGSQCLACDPSCLTCDGASATSCLSCPSTPVETYLLSSNQSCVACNVDGYSPVGLQCIQCDLSCLHCNGTTSTDCIACPPSKYLLSSNNSCVDCDVDGYSPVGLQCIQCDLSCLACSEKTPTSCVACPPLKYMISSNHSCVDCNEDGYVVSGSECLQCDSSCLTCNGTSSNNCLSCSPEKTLQNSTCIIPDPPNDFFNYTTGEVAKGVSQAQSIVSAVMPALTGGVSTSAILLVGFLADVDIYTYINVPYPENFVSFCDQMRTPALPNFFSNLDIMHGGNNPNSTIGKFQFWGLSTTLFDNSYATIFKELVILGIILGVNVLVCIFKSYPTISKPLLKIQTIFMWNVFLSFYLGDFSELQLNSMVQLRENSVWSGYTILSFVFAVLVVASYPLLLGYLISKTNQRLSGTGNEFNHQQWVKVPPSIEILVEDFNGTNSFTRNFIFVMLLETFLQILIIFFLQDNGLTQAILYTIIIAVSIVLIAWQRPYKSRMQMGILLLNQTSKGVMGIQAILLGMDNTIQFLSPESIDVMGSVLTILILTVIGINGVLSSLIMLVSLFQSIKVCCMRARKNQPSFRSAKKRINLNSTKKRRAIQDQNQSLDEVPSFDSQIILNNKNRWDALSRSNDTSKTLINRMINSIETQNVLNAAQIKMLNKINFVQTTQQCAANNSPSKINIIDPFDKDQVRIL